MERSRRNAVLTANTSGPGLDVETNTPTPVAGKMSLDVPVSQPELVSDDVILQQLSNQRR
jgi:hypothetical protein